MKLRKRDLFLLVAAPALVLGAIGTVGGLRLLAEVRAEAAEGKIATLRPCQKPKPRHLVMRKLLRRIVRSIQQPAPTREEKSTQETSCNFS